jgi:hypothetical protein
MVLYHYQNIKSKLLFPVYKQNVSCAIRYNPNTCRIFFGIWISRNLFARLLAWIQTFCYRPHRKKFSWLSSSTMNVEMFTKLLVVAAAWYWWEPYLLNSSKWSSFLYIPPNFLSKLRTSALTIKLNSMVPKSSHCFLPI